MNGKVNELAASHEKAPVPPLAGTVVLEFGSLVPGPLTSLLLAEAGAQVIKVERPPMGDAMRSYEPKIGNDSVHFHMLNRGKTSIFADLNDEADRRAITSWLERADIMIDQFRPGVLERLGLGYDHVSSINPRIIYCSLTGWGQSGPKAKKAAHDLNFLAESGHLDLTCGIDGAPVLPPLLAADIAGGVYPAVINILLAYIQRQVTGKGTHLDIAISDGLMTFHYDALAQAIKMNEWPKRGEGLVTGGSPRYQLYRTSDGRHMAVAAMEDKFWNNFCDMIDLDDPWRDPLSPPEEVKREIMKRVLARSSGEWRAAMEGKDVCCSIVARLEEAVNDPHNLAREVIGRQVLTKAGYIPALPLPIARQFRTESALESAPEVPQP
ncbi:CaiB/BaiF CoA transferase family protein [Sphingobium yanoikuyae]|uniref:CoA transferase n=1 Tax=Sphingobium yanoikuyae TaxID=13690 RepID=A0A430C8W2_SPHYA|nr:CaiB/BaiF CoA-transferase family protein [Sphingobium yanoikuyae]RSU61351.1 CoA transferase [Sphingobium yanoikuyae]